MLISVSAPGCHGPPNRHVLLRRRPSVPGHPPAVWLQSPLSHFFHPERLCDAYSLVCSYWRRRGCGWGWWSSVPVRLAHPVPVQSVLPTHAVWNELLLGRWLCYLCRCHYRHHLQYIPSSWLHGESSFPKQTLNHTHTNRHLPTAGLVSPIRLGRSLDLHHHPLGPERPPSREESLAWRPCPGRRPLHRRCHRSNSPYTLQVRPGEPTLSSPLGSWKARGSRIATGRKRERALEWSRLKYIHPDFNTRPRLSIRITFFFVAIIF